MHEIRIHEDADEELIAAAVYYESCVAALGEAFLVEAAKGFEQIQLHPLAWPVLSDNFHKYLVHRFPYALIYTFQAETVLFSRWRTQNGSPVIGVVESKSQSSDNRCTTHESSHNRFIRRR